MRDTYDEVHQLTRDALDEAAMAGRKIDCFLMPRDSWESMRTVRHMKSDPTITENRFMGVLVELYPTLLGCVHRSIEMSYEGKVGWIINPYPFDNLIIRPAFE